MTEKPILMNAEMVQATLDNRKRQTRRVVKPMPDRRNWIKVRDNGRTFGNHICDSKSLVMAPYQVGDHLYVRETWRTIVGYDDIKPSLLDDTIPIIYEADEHNEDGWIYGKCRPNIFMPKWMARIWLEVTNVRVERVQDISREDAQAEGVLWDHLGWRDYGYPEEERRRKSSSRQSFHTLWDSLAKPEHQVSANPWVFVYDLERIEK